MNYNVQADKLIICFLEQTRRCRVVGRARTIGNRVRVKSSSRVRISPSPPKIKTCLLAGFYFYLRSGEIRIKIEHAGVPGYTPPQRLPLEGKLAAEPTDEVAGSRRNNFRQKRRISTSSAQCAHWAPSPQRGRLEKASSFPTPLFFDSLKRSARHPAGCSFSMQDG